MTSLQPERLDIDSLDIAGDNRAKLKALFPSVFAETRDEQGELVESIDFEKLKAELGSFSDVFENRRDRYGMDWPGKKDCIKLVQQPATGTLKPCREESVNFDSTENLFIEGDNLEVLKLLQKSYYGKVKMIYIDPPYNTGKEFIYPDHYAETLETYLAYAGLVDDEGKKFSTNTANEGRFHTRWLNMMYPRLYLARNLLREDGCIFISIDDHEVVNLRNICSEIFGEENFVANIVWQKKYSVSNDDPGIAAMHDHILVFQKSSFFKRNLFPRTQKQSTRYKNVDNDERGAWASGEYVSSKSRLERPTLWYSIRHPKTGKEVWPDENAVWRYSKEKHLLMESENRLYWGPDGNYEIPRLKRFLAEIKDGVVPSTWWSFNNFGHNDEGQKETGDLLGKKIFSTPKPLRLLKKIIALASSDSDIVLDFFAGSGATAHATIALNVEDKTNRKFIMVQLPEPCDKKSEALKAGYETITDIGVERVRRAIKNIEAERENQTRESEEIISVLTRPLSQIDLGFKVLKLDRSNFKPWDGSNPDGALLICLENEITRDLIDAIAAADPLQFLCLDKAFNGNDQLKANAVQAFNSLNQSRDKAIPIIFKTV
ncbi:MAG: site-specific DNA-methyltransferase [Phormidesmis priestleyi]|uniref:Site-specific DNA-methyltransferase n=1 Tax=Phormidesmis priestleyi TaxID=268141 RepID=A0A2W4ZJE3_9CYAN|nr:MAG: site-specific DNA-methyltransferase [Phormidesmis priestleyi]